MHGFREQQLTSLASRTSRTNTIIIVDITDKAERKLCFELAEAAGLDIASITKTVVENIRGKVS